MNKFLTFVGGAVMVITVPMAAGLVWAVVFAHFWAWFIQSLFVAAPDMTFIQAYGVQLVVQIFFRNAAPYSPFANTKVSVGTKVLLGGILSAIGALMVWGIGALFHALFF